MNLTSSDCSINFFSGFVGLYFKIWIIQIQIQIFIIEIIQNTITISL